MADPSDFDASQFLTLYIDDTDSDPPTGWVTFLQQRLQFKGFDPGPIDGIFGSRTEAAVKAAQTWGGATVDGVVGNQTWGVLHDAFGVAGGTNRARPHRGSGGGSGGAHDLSNNRVLFSTTPFYSSTTDHIHFDLVMARGVPSIVLTVTSPGSRHAKIVLDSGRGDSRTFTFEPNFTASEP